MAPGKKVKARKHKGTGTGSAFEYQPPNVYELGAKPSMFVRCKICSTALPHLNFEWPAVPTELTLSAVREAIIKRHGSALPKILLYKDVVHPDTSLADVPDGTTLKELGVEGAFMSGPDAMLPVLLLHYDFTATRSDDAVVAVEPDKLESKHDVPMKLYRRLSMSVSQGVQGSMVQRSGGSLTASASSGGLAGAMYGGASLRGAR